MKVKHRMTTNPITASPKTTHREAVELMKRHRITRLPILDEEGHLVGIVTEEDLLLATPAPSASQGVYDIYQMLDRLTLGHIMTSPVYAVDEECSLAMAARFMLDRDVSCLPVMRGDQLVGIITEMDIFKTFVEVLGGGEPGLRILLRVPERKGVLAAIAQAVSDAGGNIVTLSTFWGDDPSHRLISIKEREADADQLRAALEKLTDIEILEIRPAAQDKLLELGKRDTSKDQVLFIP